MPRGTPSSECEEIFGCNCHCGDCATADGPYDAKNHCNDHDSGCHLRCIYVE